jgi:hypothetical protein
MMVKRATLLRVKNQEMLTESSNGDDSFYDDTEIHSMTERKVHDREISMTGGKMQSFELNTNA